MKTTLQMMNTIVIKTSHYYIHFVPKEKNKSKFVYAYYQEHYIGAHIGALKVSERGILSNLI